MTRGRVVRGANGGYVGQVFRTRVISLVAERLRTARRVRMRLLLLIQSAGWVEGRAAKKSTGGLVRRSCTRTRTRGELNRLGRRSRGRQKKLFVTRGARGETRPWNSAAWRGGEEGYIRGRDRSFMQGAIVNQSASTGGLRDRCRIRRERKGERTSPAKRAGTRGE